MSYFDQMNKELEKLAYEAGDPADSERLTEPATQPQEKEEDPLKAKEEKKKKKLRMLANKKKAKLVATPEESYKEDGLDSEVKVASVNPMMKLASMAPKRMRRGIMNPIFNIRKNKSGKFRKVPLKDKIRSV